MSLATIRSGIKSKLETLTDINNVLDYVVWTDDWQTIYSLFRKNGRVDTWMISLQNTPQHQVNAEDKNITWLFNITGYYSIQTTAESSKQFETNIETILNGFGASKNPLGLPGVTLPQAPLLTTVANTVYVQNPAHTAVIQMGFNEIVNQTLTCGA